MPIRLLKITLLMVATTFLCLSCSSRDEKSVTPESDYASLEEKDDVVTNLLLAIQRRDLGQMERVLASHFIFYFSEQDLRLGIVSRESWGRAEELQALSHIFSDPPPPSEANLVLPQISPTWGSFKEQFLDSVPSWPGYISDLKMMFYKPEDLDWVAVEGAPQCYKDVYYTFSMHISADEYPRDYGGYYMRLVIVQEELDGELVWRLVECHDNYHGSPSNTRMQLSPRAAPGGDSKSSSVS